MSPYARVPYTAAFLCGIRSGVTKVVSVRGTAARDGLLSSLTPVLNWKFARPEKVLWLWNGITTQILGTATDLLRNSRKQIFKVAKFSSSTLL